MNTYGFIVGIEKYREEIWTVPGPCANAIAAAEWLLSTGVPGGNIRLFLWPSRDVEKEIARMQAAGVDVRRAGDAGSIEAFWRKELPRGVPAKSRLLVFWSGHGFTSGKRHRIFFCNDYDEDLPGRVFNGTNFLNNLMTAKYACFSNQIFLADVCGSYSDIKVDDNVEELDLRERSQLAYFATPEGDYAMGDDGRGVFTSTVTEVLGRLGDWPAQQDFIRELDKAFAQVGTKPFRISGHYDQGQIRETVVGSVPAGDGNAHFQSLFALLSELDVTEGAFRPHYLRTVSELGNPELAKAQGLAGALKELSSLRDGTPGKAVPRGLLQFLLRLAGEGNLREPIESWLEKHAGGQKNTLAEIREKLAAEAQTRILLIVTAVDARERIESYKAYLCNSDFSLVPDWKSPIEKVSGSEEFERSLQKLLAQFVAEGYLANLEIHFVVDAPLFDRPFHMIPLAPGEHPIGEDVVVVVRHKQRILSSDQRLRRAWQDRAEMLRAAKPEALKWLKLLVGGELPEDKALFLATFTLPPPIEGKPAGRAEKNALLRLLKLGNPYLYLAHSGPAAADWDKVADELTKLLRRKPTVGEFPSTFLDERIRGGRIASSGTIIWDDPMAVPFSTTEGVRFG
jgi:hypothetical protein